MDSVLKRFVALSLAGLTLILSATSSQAWEDHRPYKHLQCLSKQQFGLLEEERHAEAEAAIAREAEGLTPDSDPKRHACLMYFLSLSKMRQGQFQSAIAVLTLTLESSQRHFPESSDQVIYLKRLLAGSQGMLGRLDDEIRLLEEVKPHVERRHGADSTSYANLLSNLSVAHSGLKHHAEAIQYARQALETTIKAVRSPAGYIHQKEQLPTLALARMRLAERLMINQEATLEAWELARDALPEVRASYGERHSETLHAQVIHAMAMPITGDIAESYTQATKVHANAQSILGAQHPITRQAKRFLDFIGAKRLAMGNRVQHALERYNASVKRHGVAHPEPTRLAVYLSDALIEASQLSDALLVTNQAIRGLVKLRRESSIPPQQTASWLVTQRRLLENHLIGLATARQFDDAFLAAEHFKTRLLQDRIAIDEKEPSLEGATRKQYRATRLELARLGQTSGSHLSSSALAGRRQALSEKLQELLLTSSSEAPQQLPSLSHPPAWTDILSQLTREKTVYISFVRMRDNMAALAYTDDGRILFTPVGQIDVLRTLTTFTRHLLHPRSPYERYPARIWRSPQGEFRIGLNGNSNEEEVTQPDLFLSELANMLFKNMAPILAGREAILISPDDVITHIPFAALPYQGKPLVEQFRVAHITSLETLERSRRNHVGKTTAPKLLAFANARYERVERYSDRIMIQHEEAHPTVLDIKTLRQETRNNPDLLPSAMLQASIQLPNLHASEEEAEAIARLFRDAGGSAVLLSGNLASEDTWNTLIANGELRSVQAIHFSAHGLLGDEDAALASIALSQIHRNPGSDGFLTATELSALNLNADLVAITPVNTASAGFIDGEGALGLTQGLFEAGVRHVLLSLWPMRSKASKSFLENFYQHYLDGETPPVALASAQRKAISENIPIVEWAGFFLHGL